MKPQPMRGGTRKAHKMIGLEFPVITLGIQGAFFAWGAWQYAEANLEQQNAD
jgi:hypothetical protein